MSQTALSIEQDQDNTVVFQINTSLTVQPSKSTPLRDYIQAIVREHFARLDGARLANLYELFLTEMEIPYSKWFCSIRDKTKVQRPSY